MALRAPRARTPPLQLRSPRSLAIALLAVAGCARPGATVRHLAPAPSLEDVVPTAADQDGDGLDDVEEAELLARFRPLLKFTAGPDGPDEARPAPWDWYVARCDLVRVVDSEVLDRPPSRSRLATGAELSRSPDRLVGAADALRTGGRPSDVCLAPRDEARGGVAWADVFGGAGVHGHVSPIAGDRVRIEYWLFFPENLAHAPFGLFDHEGDWEVVYLEAARATRAVERIVWSHHGTAVEAQVSACAWSDAELAGTATDGAPSRDRVRRCAQGGRDAFYLASAVGGVEATHPAVFVERGAHGLWPTAGGTSFGAPSHAGRSWSFVPAKVVDVGELRWPRAGYAPLLRFAGRWGSVGSSTDTPPGPALHAQWNDPHRVLGDAWRTP